ncbi:MAG: DUF4129 domain-containing protein [Defluviitaleaceae bacterium]|nr:DUF4129 domain-containing protein [Defluviitaleaceae bacterium]
MILLYANKILVDLTLYYSFVLFLYIGFARVTMRPVVILLLVLMACAVFAFALYEKLENKALRFLALGLLVAYFVWMPMEWMYVLFALPPVFYVVYHVSLMPKLKGSYDYTHVFVLYMRIYLPMAVVFMLISATRMYMQTYSIPFALVFIIAAVHFMRLSKHDAHVDKPFQRANRLVMGSVVLLGVGLGTPWVVSFVRTVIGFIIVDGVYAAVLYVVDQFLVLLSWLLSLLPVVEPFEEEAQEVIAQEMKGMPATFEESEFSLQIIFVIFIAIIIIALLIILFKKLLDANIKIATTDEKNAYEYRVQIGKLNKSQRVRNPMRKIFRRFIQLCHQRGIIPRTTATGTCYVQDATTQFNLTNEAQELYALYKPIRYGNKPCTSEEINAAKKWLKQIKRNP